MLIINSDSLCLTDPADLTSHHNKNVLALKSQLLLPRAAQEASSTRRLMGGFRVAAEPILDAHDLIDTLVRRADHFAEIV